MCSTTSYRDKREKFAGNKLFTINQSRTCSSNYQLCKIKLIPVSVVLSAIFEVNLLDQLKCMINWAILILKKK